MAATTPSLESSTRSSLSPTSINGRLPELVLIRDNQNCLPLSKLLSDDDLIVLLTPVIVPPTLEEAEGEDYVARDPFEPLGRALSRHHGRVRQLPYTARGGIESTHVVYIRRAKVVVFVVTGSGLDGQYSQVQLSELVRADSTQRAHVVIACCDLRELGRPEPSIPTLVRMPGLTTADLKSAADLLFQDTPPSTAAALPMLQHLMLSNDWTVENWDAYRDLPTVHELWTQCLPEQFHLDKFTFQSLVVREGYAKHYVVRAPDTKDLVGFCATYTTYMGGDSEDLVGALALVLVKPSFRRRGIGTSLHDHALAQLKRVRGVCRLQVGTAYPRLLYGPPVDAPSLEWLKRRGWQIDETTPGTGQEVCDWLLSFSDWPERGIPPAAGLTFRQCSAANYDHVLKLGKDASAAQASLGWYDQYTNLANSVHTLDIVVGFDRSSMVAAAITYVNRSGNLVADNIPWAGTIGERTGGVTCITIAGQFCASYPLPFPSASSSLQADRARGERAAEVASKPRKIIMVQLLGACIKVLKEQGMKGVLLDAIGPGHEDEFQSMGFKKWAAYRDIWRENRS